MAINQVLPPQAALTTSVPNRRERLVAIGVIASSIGTFVAMAPFARLPVARLDAFIPIYESALATCDLITAVLLFGQFARTRSRAVLVLASGYLFSVLIIIPHALTFPGVFAPQGLLGAGPQTTAWLYCFWHEGFALFVVAYATIAGRDHDRPAQWNSALAITVAAMGTAVLVTSLAGWATVRHDSLPPLINGVDYSLLVSSGISPAICLTSLVALSLLWRRRTSALDLWLFVVMSAWLCDVMLSAVVGSNRFDLGWYGGRTYGLLAGSFLLIILLGELNHLHRKVAEALADAQARNIELAKTREDLAHAQRLDAMGQLTGGVAHDFNNLLMIVTGSMDMILRSPGNVAKVEKFARAALVASGRGQRLTQQLLTFARKQIGNPVTIDPNRLLSDLAPLLQHTVGSSIEIKTALSPVVDLANVDPAQFEAAIVNLIINARDASSPAGRVTIATANVTVTSAGDASGVAPGDYVVVSVADEGCGMSSEVMAQAFDPFFTTKGVGHGSGLGLSQVYGFVKSACGHVKIQSELGKGTTIRLYLPKSSTPVLSAEPRQTRLPLRAARGGEVILAVEDDEQVLELAAGGLTELGYAVRTADNAEEALRLLRGTERIDLLFSDVIMPGGMNGAQLAVEARRIRPGLKVLLTSGYTAEALANEHGLPDDLLVLGKPYRHEDLANKIRIVIGG